MMSPEENRVDQGAARLLAAFGSGQTQYPSATLDGHPIKEQLPQ